ncbi:MAG: outer membrane homotrimeric porin, partial [Deltaproteobacteria bacterium]|nr:outer membrane homotrimeric porin [Deltaproteobacteria bacterium]
MKRIIALLLGAAFIFGSALQASALEVGVSGEMDFAFGFTDNAGFSKDDETDHFFARQRARIQVDFVASENLRGVIQMQFGSEDDQEWGSSEAGYALDTTNTSPYVRRAYIDFNLPETPVNVKMGLHYIAMPSAVFGNPFWGGEMAGVSLTASLTDEVSITAAWARPWRDTSGNLKNNDTDMFGLFVDFNYDQFVISPWISYASAGSHSGFWENGYTTLDEDEFPNGVWFDDKSNVYAGGIALAVTPVDALEIKFDAMYAKLKNDSSDSTTTSIGGNNIDALEGDGWLVALAIDYSLDWGTPGFFAWYASGDD